jgi:acid phosphatase (class A)
MRLRILALTCVIALCACPALAKTKALMVLTPGEVEPVLLLPPPPAEESMRERADLATVRAAIAADTPERYAQAKWDDGHEDASAFYAVIGGGFDLGALPATAAVLQAAQNDAGFVASEAKAYFSRKRPWAVDPAIKTCDPGDKPLTSYPSGHATVGYTVSLVLAQLMPEKAQAILARAADYAFSRELCGSHFPSDAEASHVVSVAVVSAMVRHAGFREQLAAARKELAAKGFTKGD